MAVDEGTLNDWEYVGGCKAKMTAERQQERAAALARTKDILAAARQRREHAPNAPGDGGDCLAHAASFAPVIHYGAFLALLVDGSWDDSDQYFYPHGAGVQAT